MALASGVRSSLNPNAPIFVPAALRQVEDFSPEWWDLVTTSTWFRDYWLSEHSEEDILGIGDDFDNQEVVDLLPDTFDLCADDDFLGLDAQFDEFIQYSDSVAAKRLQGGDALKNLTVARTTKERLAKCSFEPKAWEKPPQRVTTKCSPRRIQQPR